jgi:hypothetical protein
MTYTAIAPSILSVGFARLVGSAIFARATEAAYARNIAGLRAATDGVTRASDVA